MNDILRRNQKLFTITLLTAFSVSILNVLNYILIGSNISFTIQGITRWDILKSWYYIIFVLNIIVLLNFLFKKKFIISLAYVITFLCTLFLAFQSSKIL